MTHFPRRDGLRPLPSFSTSEGSVNSSLDRDRTTPSSYLFNFLCKSLRLSDYVVGSVTDNGPLRGSPYLTPPSVRRPEIQDDGIV